MSFSRRDFLRCSTGLAAAALPLPRLLAQPRFSDNPFTLGVASGYPSPHGVVLWTRLAPETGMPQAAVEVAWEISADESFRKVVRQGKETAEPQWAHSVHAEAGGLAPARDYFYRFRAGGVTSPTGRTRTMPDAGAIAERLRFAFGSCQHYEQGYFTAYRHMAREDLDLVVHLGDYIYESSWGRNHVRKHDAGEPATLEEYRDRYALYKRDSDLQAAHAAIPWIVTWDDHEVQNDYANDRSQNLDAREEFLARRAAAYQAYYEHLPLPRHMRPRGPDALIYTRLNYGGLAAFHVVDDRQYRSHQVCARAGRGGGNVVRADECPERLDPQLTLLGAAQEKWLHDGLAAAATNWNFIAQQTLMAQVDRTAGEGQSFWTDGWDGYPKARERLLAFVESRRVANPVVLSGDVHTFAAAELKVDFDRPGAPAVATEFCGGSLTSQGPTQKQTQAWQAENPHVLYANGSRHGYVTMEINARRCTARMRAVNEKEPDAPVHTLAAWTVENGRPGAQRGS